MNWPNLVSYLRILLIPLVILCFFSGLPNANFWAAFLARCLNQTSKFGAFLDPVADKLLVAIVLIALVAAYPSLLLATAVIITRELLISALREWMATKGQREVVAVAFSGKLKTIVQMIAIIGLLLYIPAYPSWAWQMAFVLIQLAALLSVYSMFHYFRNAWNSLQDES